MKKLIKILTLVAILAGAQQPIYGMNAPTEVRPFNRLEAQASLRVLYSMLMNVAAKNTIYPMLLNTPGTTTFDPDKRLAHNEQLKNISALIEAMLPAMVIPKAEHHALIKQKGIGDLLYNIAQENNHKATMNWLVLERLVDAQGRFLKALAPNDDRMDAVAAEFWLQHGADINKKRISGNTILANFVKNREALEKIKWLLEHGANPNQQDESGFTPLHHAVYNADGKRVNLLLDHGAQTDIKNFRGATAQDIYFMLVPESRQDLKDAGIAKRLGIEDTEIAAGSI